MMVVEMVDHRCIWNVDVMESQAGLWLLLISVAGEGTLLWYIGSDASSPGPPSLLMSLTLTVILGVRD